MVYGNMKSVWYQQFNVHDRDGSSAVSHSQIFKPEPFP